MGVERRDGSRVQATSRQYLNQSLMCNIVSDSPNSRPAPLCVLLLGFLVSIFLQKKLASAIKTNRTTTVIGVAIPAIVREISFLGKVISFPFSEIFDESSFLLVSNRTFVIAGLGFKILAEIFLCDSLLDAPAETKLGSNIIFIFLREIKWYNLMFVLSIKTVKQTLVLTIQKNSLQFCCDIFVQVGKMAQLVAEQFCVLLSIRPKLLMVPTELNT